MSFLVSPGVHVKEIDLTNVVPAVATSIGAIAGPFEKGDVSSILANGLVEQLKYKNIYSLQGGIKAWNHLKFPLKNNN